MTEAQFDSLLTEMERKALKAEGLDTKSVLRDLDTLFRKDLDGDEEFRAEKLLTDMSNDDDRAPLMRLEEEAERKLKESLIKWKDDEKNAPPAFHLKNILGFTRFSGMLYDSYVKPKILDTLDLIYDPDWVETVHDGMHAGFALMLMKGKEDISAKSVVDELYPDFGKTDIGARLMPRLQQIAGWVINDEDFKHLIKKASSLIHAGAYAYIREKTLSEMKDHRNALTEDRALAYGWLAVGYETAFDPENGINAVRHAPADLQKIQQKLAWEYDIPGNKTNKMFSLIGAEANRIAFASLLEANRESLMKDYGRAFADLYMKRVLGVWPTDGRRVSEEGLLEKRFDFIPLKDPSKEALRAEKTMRETGYSLMRLAATCHDCLGKFMDSVHHDNHFVSRNCTRTGYSMGGDRVNTDRAIMGLPESLRVYALESEIRTEGRRFFHAGLMKKKEGSPVEKRDADAYAEKWADEHPDTMKKYPEALPALRKVLDDDVREINELGGNEAVLNAVMSFTSATWTLGPSFYLEQDNRAQLNRAVHDVTEEIRKDLLKEYGVPGKGCSDVEAEKIIAGTEEAVMGKLNGLPVPDEKASGLFRQGMEKVGELVMDYRRDPYDYIIREAKGSHVPWQDERKMADIILKDFGKYGMDYIFDKVLPEVAERWKGEIAMEPRDEYDLNDVEKMLRNMIEISSEAAKGKDPLYWYDQFELAYIPLSYAQFERDVRENYMDKDPKDSDSLTFMIHRGGRAEHIGFDKLKALVMGTGKEQGVKETPSAVKQGKAPSAVKKKKVSKKKPDGPAGGRR